MVFRNPIVAGLKLIRDAIESPNYVPGTAGWSIRKDGSAEFGNLVARGDLTFDNEDGDPFSLQKWVTWQSTLDRTVGKYSFAPVSVNVNSSTPVDVVDGIFVFDDASNPFNDNILYYEFIAEFDCALTTAPTGSSISTLVLELSLAAGGAFGPPEDDQAVWSTREETNRIVLAKTWRVKLQSPGPLTGAYDWKITARLSGASAVYRVLNPHTVIIVRQVGSGHFG